MLAVAATPAAAAAGNREICVDKVSVYDAPGGFVIAYLYRPQKLRVLGTARRKAWSLVRFDDGPRGWIPTRKICR
ncbi:SH3 domain-containing protein [Solirubrobacter soli]|uniref:SH3 domain-containing protein n=1 Tax=Solirubrobacter soli TaxID=363832 RepID=UPI00040284E5|nr:SH3 domain-containing protein [Solirubrobacter soli]